jgi:hypothetical protein
MGWVLCSAWLVNDLTYERATNRPALCTYDCPSNITVFRHVPA